MLQLCSTELIQLQLFPVHLELHSAYKTLFFCTRNTAILRAFQTVSVFCPFSLIFRSLELQQFYNVYCQSKLFMLSKLDFILYEVMHICLLPFFYNIDLNNEEKGRAQLIALMLA